MSQIIVTDTELDELEFRLRSLVRAAKAQKKSRDVKQATLDAMQTLAASLRGLSIAMADDVACAVPPGRAIVCEYWQASDAIS
ncbi:MAG: hypothetical protein KF841_14305 [Phycisphaerae bacterium]|nr:hypothetical protein [Phycisphaerae bacterium]